MATADALVQALLEEEPVTPPAREPFNARDYLLADVPTDQEFEQRGAQRKTWGWIIRSPQGGYWAFFENSPPMWSMCRYDPNGACNGRWTGYISHLFKIMDAGGAPVQFGEAFNAREYFLDTGEAELLAYLKSKKWRKLTDDALVTEQWYKKERGFSHFLRQTPTNLTSDNPRFEPESGEWLYRRFESWPLKNGIVNHLRHRLAGDAREVLADIQSWYERPVAEAQPFNARDYFMDATSILQMLKNQRYELDDANPVMASKVIHDYSPNPKPDILIMVTMRGGQRLDSGSFDSIFDIEICKGVGRDWIELDRIYGVPPVDLEDKLPQVEKDAKAGLIGISVRPVGEAQPFDARYYLMTGPKPFGNTEVGELFTDERGLDVIRKIEPPNRPYSEGRVELVWSQRPGAVLGNKWQIDRNVLVYPLSVELKAGMEQPPAKAWTMPSSITGTMPFGSISTGESVAQGVVAALLDEAKKPAVKKPAANLGFDAREYFTRPAWPPIGFTPKGPRAKYGCESEPFFSGDGRKFNFNIHKYPEKRQWILSLDGWYFGHWMTGDMKTLSWDDDLEAYMAKAKKELARNHGTRGELPKLPDLELFRDEQNPHRYDVDEAQELPPPGNAFNAREYFLAPPTEKPFGYIIKSPPNTQFPEWSAKHPHWLTRKGGFSFSPFIGDAIVFKRLSTTKQWPDLIVVPVYSDPRKTGEGALDPYYVPRKFNFGKVREGADDTLLKQFAALQLKDAPKFVVDRNVRCNDVDRVGGRPECLPVAVVSYDTMQKYIVPREGGFLVPVPVGSNWHIHKLTAEQLQRVIEALAANPNASLDDFYKLAAETGSFWRQYYEAEEAFNAREYLLSDVPEGFTYEIIHLGPDYGPYGCRIDFQGQEVNWEGSCDSVEEAAELGEYWVKWFNELHALVPYDQAGYPNWHDWYSKAYSKRMGLRESAADVIAKEAAKAEQPKSPEHAEAGNYKKGHIHLNGFEIGIENAKGSTRKGVDDDGKPWSCVLPAHYGYIKGTVGKDKDHLDVYIGENPGSLLVFVVNQQKLKGGFDEHKVMLGFRSKDEAIAAYDAAFSGDLGPKLRESVVSVTVDEFKDWVDKGDLKKPFKPLKESSYAEAVVYKLLEADEPFNARDYALSTTGDRYILVGHNQHGETYYNSQLAYWTQDIAQAERFNTREAAVAAARQFDFPYNFRAEFRRVEESKAEDWIGVDLDGTLAKYTTWKGPEHIGEPIPAMAKRVKDWVAAGKKVKIFTARADDEVSVNAIKAWLKDNDLPDLEVTNLKDQHMTELWDDKAIEVEKNTGKVAEAQEPFSARDYVLAPQAQLKAIQARWDEGTASKRDLGVEAAKLVFAEKEWAAWADRWLSDEDRSSESAAKELVGFSAPFSNRDEEAAYHATLACVQQINEQSNRLAAYAIRCVALALGITEAQEPFNAREYFLNPSISEPKKTTVDLSKAIWSDDNKLRRAFSWLTRTGLGSKFGSMPIQYYQQDQIKALETIEAAAKRKNIDLGWVCTKKGVLLAWDFSRWVPLGRISMGKLVESVAEAEEFNAREWMLNPPSPDTDEVSRILVDKFGFKKHKQTKRDIRDYGAGVVTFSRGFLSITRTFVGQEHNQTWALDIYPPSGHIHGGIEQSGLLGFMEDFFRLLKGGFPKYAFYHALRLNGGDTQHVPNAGDIPPLQEAEELTKPPEPFNAREYLLADTGLADLRAWLEKAGFKRSKTSTIEDWRQSFWFYNSDARAGRHDRSDYHVWEDPAETGIWYLQRAHTRQTKRSGVNRSIDLYFKGTPEEILAHCKRWVPGSVAEGLAEPPDNFSARDFLDRAGHSDVMELEALLDTQGFKRIMPNYWLLRRPKFEIVVYSELDRVLWTYRWFRRDGSPGGTMVTNLKGSAYDMLRLLNEPVQEAQEPLDAREYTLDTPEDLDVVLADWNFEPLADNTWKLGLWSGKIVVQRYGPDRYRFTRYDEEGRRIFGKVAEPWQIISLIKTSTSPEAHEPTEMPKEPIRPPEVEEAFDARDYLMSREPSLKNVGFTQEYAGTYDLYMLKYPNQADKYYYVIVQDEGNRYRLGLNRASGGAYSHVALVENVDRYAFLDHASEFVAVLKEAVDAYGDEPDTVGIVVKNWLDELKPVNEAEEGFDAREYLFSQGVGEVIALLNEQGFEKAPASKANFWKKNWGDYELTVFKTGGGYWWLDVRKNGVFDSDTDLAKSEEFSQVLINELSRIDAEMGAHGRMESQESSLEELKKHKQSLSHEEREQVGDAGASVWKSVKDGKTVYVCNTHRAYRTASTLKGILKEIDYVETTG